MSLSMVLRKSFVILLLIYPFRLFAENLQIVQISPAWVLFNNSYFQNDGKLSYYDYKMYLQKHLMEILSSINIKAIPALYTSAFQTIYDPRSFEEINQLLRYEPKEQCKFLTLIPVIKNSTIETVSNKYCVKLSISIYAQDKNGQLGNELFTSDMEISGRYESTPANTEDIEKQLKSIREKLTNQQQWQTIKKYINDHYNEYNQFPSFKKASFFKEQLTNLFGQSDGLYFNDHPKNGNETSIRIHKSNALIITANENTDKILFDFDLSDEIPSVIYTYIITPDFKVTEVEDADIHIEKSPEALPDDTYDSRRYLVINLPGLTSGSVVCYAVKYRDYGYYDSTYFNQMRITGYNHPLARDFNINYTNDSTPWQLRIWFPEKYHNDTIHAQGNNICISDSQNIQFGLSKSLNMRTTKKSSSYSLFGKTTFNNYVSALDPTLITSTHFNFRMFLFQGISKPFPIPVVEPLAYLEPQVIRVSNVSSWDSLYSETRDSIYHILNDSKNIKHDLLKISGKSGAIDSAVFNLQNYMADSLRYIHVSFNSHKTIPSYPDSVLKRKMGDCKDYSTLFISELRAKGIDAYPALVNTSWPNSLFMTLPSYNAFNHMVVYVPKYNWWIDPLCYPIFPNLIPEYLTGLKALVLFKDSVKVFKIHENNDSTYNTIISYDINLKGQDVECKYLKQSSFEESSYIRKYLSKIDSTRYLDFIFPSEKYFKRYSTRESGLSFSGLNDKTGRLTISRKFEVSNAITTAGKSRFLNLPEMPLFAYVSIVSATNRFSDLYLPAGLICDVNIKIAGNYKVKWPTSIQKEDFGTVLHIAKMTNKEITFRFHVNKGLMTLSEYKKFKLAMDSYRNFFSNPISIQTNMNQ